MAVNTGSNRVHGHSGHDRPAERARAHQHTDKKPCRRGMAAGRLYNGPRMPAEPQRLRLDQFSFFPDEQNLAASGPVATLPDPAATCSSARTRPVQAAWCVSARP